MNIRSVSNPPQVDALEKVQDANRIKSGEAEEREANGQQLHGDAEEFRALTEEELEQVLEKVRSNKGLQDSGLLVELDTSGEKPFIVVVTPDGHVLRRFNERDLFAFLFQGRDEKVYLVDKTA